MHVLTSMPPASLFGTLYAPKALALFCCAQGARSAAAACWLGPLRASPHALARAARLCSTRFGPPLARPPCSARPAVMCAAPCAGCPAAPHCTTCCRSDAPRTRVRQMTTPTARTITVANHCLNVISFVDRRPPNANPQWEEFIAQYQLEGVLYGAHFHTTGAVYRLLKRAGVGGQSLPLRRASVADGLLSNEEFDELKVLLDNDWLRSFTLIPLDAVQTAMMTFGPTPVSIALLAALGMPQPAGWASSSSGEVEEGVEGADEEEQEGEEQAEDGEEEEEEGGEVEDEADDEEGNDGGHASSNGSSGSGSGGGGSSDAEDGNARSRSHDGDDDDYPPTEVVSEAEVVGGDDDEHLAAQRRSPAIAVSPKLQTQLQAFERHRSATINRQRRGKAVAKITVASDRRSILHFLAWLQHEKGVAAPSLGVFASPKIGRVVQEFVEAKQLTCKHSRMAKLLGSLVSAARFAHAVLTAKAAPGKTVSAAPLNELHRTSHAEPCRGAQGIQVQRCD